MGKTKAKNQWKNRIVGQGEQPASQFMANSLNFRRHPGNQRNALRGSLSELGWIQNVIVNRTTGNVIDGHARIEEALSLGDETPVPFVEVEISESEEKLALAILDPISAMATADKEALDLLLREVSTGDADLQQLLSDIAAKEGLYLTDEKPLTGEGGDDFDATPEETQTRVQYGDLWELGEHRLLCGDSTKAEDVARCLGNDKPHLMVTDPPYGVEYDANWRNEALRADGSTSDGRAIGKVANDDRVDWTEAWKLFPGDVLYCWHAGKFAGEVQSSIERAGFAIRSQIIWAKSNFAIGRGDYHWKHEPCWYAVKDGATGHWASDRSQTTLWEIEKPAKSETGHSTQKPLECMERPIRNNSKAGDLVYEPFGGSGTTLIACERINRKARVIEIEPKYVNVILSRWEAETGKQAKLLERLNG